MIRVKDLSVLLVLTLAVSTPGLRVGAQEKESKPGEKAAEAPPGPPPKEESSVTDHTIKIGSQTIPYKATAATILIKNEKDEPTALIYYTGYTRSDVKDMSQRPVAFLYNGGPGPPPVWVHLGSMSPRGVSALNARVRPPPPYKSM